MYRPGFIKFFLHVFLLEMKKIYLSLLLIGISVLEISANFWQLLNKNFVWNDLFGIYYFAQSVYFKVLLFICCQWKMTWIYHF